MLSAWYLVVRGPAADLTRVRELCEGSTDHSLAEEQPREWRLRSRLVGSSSGHEEAWPALRQLLTRLSDVAAGAAETRLDLTAGALGRTGPDGGSDVYVFPETIRIRARVFAPTVMVNGIPAESPPSRLMRLQATNDHLRLALHFLNAELSWFNLWKAFEAIRAANHGQKRLVAMGWSSEADLRRFSETANTYAAVGDAARHALPETPPPPDPMGLEEAEDYVRALLARWIAALPEPEE